MSNSDDFIDVRIRLERDESPLLFAALEKISARPGSRKRTLFFRQLAEMGLMMQEDRMRREPAVAPRASSAAVREVSAAPATSLAGAERTAAADTPMQAPARETQPVPLAAPAPVVAQAPNPAAAPQALPPPATQAPVAVAAQVQARDDDRPPPRVAGQGGRRLLGGEDYA